MSTLAAVLLIWVSLLALVVSLVAVGLVNSTRREKRRQARLNEFNDQAWRYFFEGGWRR